METGGQSLYLLRTGQVEIGSVLRGYERRAAVDVCIGGTAADAPMPHVGFEGFYRDPILGPGEMRRSEDVRSLLETLEPGSRGGVRA